MVPPQAAWATPMKIPSWEGKGWVLPFGTTHPDTPPMDGNAIFMLNGAAQAAWGTPMKITETRAPTARQVWTRQIASTARVRSRPVATPVASGQADLDDSAKPGVLGGASPRCLFASLVESPMTLMAEEDISHRSMDQTEDFGTSPLAAEDISL